MTKDIAAQKIITACHHAQAGGFRVHGISGPDGLTTWTGTTESQVWSGLDTLRDAATQYGTDLIACVDHYYVVGDTHACIAWLLARSKYVTTAVRRIEEMGAAVAAATGDRRHTKVANQARRAVRETNQLVADLLAI
jgi:hypothetical protein